MKHALNRFFLILIFVPLYVGCENTSFDCVRKTGSPISIEMELPDFHSIDAYSGINLFIKEGDGQALRLEIGENLLENIDIHVNDEGHLIVKNNNSCNWIRSYQDINLYITTDTLVHINQYGFGTIRSQEKWSFPSVTINAKDGVGDIYVEVENQRLYLVSNSIANFYISGNTENFIIGNYYSNGRFSAKELVARNVSINHLGSNTIIVNATETLKGTIGSVGDIVYYGAPEIVDVKIEGKGQLIHK